jgi:hypothetical protein
MRKFTLIAGLISLSITLFAQGSGTPSTLRVKTDANGYLVTVAAAQTNPISQGTFSSRILKTDANGNLLTVNTGGPISGVTSFAASTCAGPSIAETGALTTGFAFTATPSILDCVNGTARNTLTATTLTSTVQYLLPDGTSSAPAYSFSADATMGFFRSAAKTFSFGNNGTTEVSIDMVNNTFSLAEDTYQLRFGGSSDVVISRGAANVLTLASGDMLSFGGVGAGNLLLKPNGSGLQIKAGDDSGFTDIKVGSVTTGAGAILFSSTAPTVTSAGTSPSVPNSNGTMAFRVNVGTGGTATTIVMSMPAATTGWNCDAENITSNAANRANQQVVQQASTTTSVTVQNQTISTGAALAFTASDIVRFICVAF